MKWIKSDLNFPGHVGLYTLRKFLSKVTENVFKPNYLHYFWPVSDVLEENCKIGPKQSCEKALR